MPRITLTDGRTAIISVHKSTIVKKKKNKELSRRRVSAKIMVLQPLKEGQERADVDLNICAEAICSENDKFSPKYGRQEAVRRLLRIIGGRVDRKDRETIIRTLCPELFLTTTDRMRMEYARLKKIFESDNKVEIQHVA